jgi:hypothetical protein
MMAGFLLLAFASVLFLNSPARIKRVVGAIVITAQMLVVFLYYMSQFASLR